RPRREGDRSSSPKGETGHSSPKEGDRSLVAEGKETGHSSAKGRRPVIVPEGRRLIRVGLQRLLRLRIEEVQPVLIELEANGLVGCGTVPAVRAGYQQLPA